MTKHRIRESIKSFFGSHIDPERDEQLKGTKKEIEDKVKKILNLIKAEESEENNGISLTNSKREPIVDLIEDLHRNYQNLHAEYDHLTGELRKRVHGRREKDDSSSSSSDSDTDHSSKEGSSKNGKLRSEFQRITDGMKQELETANLEITELRRKLMTDIAEKDALNSEYQTALSKIKEADEIIASLKLESEKLETESSRILVQNGELQQKMDCAGRTEAEMSQRLEDARREKDNLILEKESALSRIEEGEKIAEDFRSMVNRLNDENLKLRRELETSLGEVSNTTQQLKQAEGEVSNFSLKLTASEEENQSLNLKLQYSSTELQKAQDVIQQLVTEMSQLKDQLCEKERELSAVTEMHEVRGNQSSAQIKELEGQVRSLELELGSLQMMNREMESKIESETTEAKGMREKNEELHARVAELEMTSQQREDELLAVQKKLESNENESFSRIQDLTMQVNKLVVELESLHTEKARLEEQIVSRSDESSIQIKGLMDQVNVLQQELETAYSQKAEMEFQLSRKTQEVLDYMSQIEKLKEDAASKIEHERRILQEKEGLLAKINNLKAEVDSLGNQRGELEEQIQRKIEESGLLQEEKLGLQDKIIELEKTLTQKELEFSSLQEKHANVESEASSRVTALVEQINDLREQLDSLKTQLNQLELQLERRKQESLEKTDQMESQKSELLSQITDQQRQLKVQEEAYEKLREEYEQVKSLFENCKLNLEVAERKMGEMTEEFHKNTASKDQAEADLKQMINGLQRDLEAKGDEFIKQVADHQKRLKEQEDSYKRLSEDYEQVASSFQECKLKLAAAEEKMQQMTEEHNKHIQLKDLLILDMEQTIEDLKRDLEVKGDESHTLVEKVSNIEVKLRLSNQKLRITEQLLTEREESFRKAEAKFLEEQRMLEDKVSTLSETIVTNNRAHWRMIMDISERVNGTFGGIESVVIKLKEECGNYEQCISEKAKQLRSAKNWVAEMKRQKEQLEKERNDLADELQDKKEHESMLREQNEELRSKTERDEVQKENLNKSVKQLEKKVELLETMMKEKDEGTLILREEKREAIRQLCIQIEYHRERCDYLKEILSKLRGRRQPRSN